MVDILFFFSSTVFAAFGKKKMLYQSVPRAAAQHVANSTWDVRFGIFTAVRICAMISWVTIL